LAVHQELIQQSCACDPSPDHFLSYLENCADFGQTTRIDKTDGIACYTNEFWTAKQRQGNRIHEISYRACFKPQLPSFFIQRLTRPGDIVYDPFMGRGTTLIEAALQGRIPYGNDTNPLSKALVEPRLNPPSLTEISQRLGEIPWNRFQEIENEDLLVFYHPQTLTKLEGLRNWLFERSRSGDLELVDKWIRMVAINRLSGHSPGFFSVYTLPPNQAATVKNQARINEKKNQSPPLRDVAAIIEKKSRRLLSSARRPVAKQSFLLTESSHRTAQIAESSVALTVTSPPFLNIVNYETDNWLRCWFLGIDPKSVKIAQIGNIDRWEAFIAKSLKELARVTHSGGYIAFEVGEVRRRSVRLEHNVISAGEGLALEPIAVIINQQDFTKTANIWGVSNNTGGTNTNRIVLFKRR